MKPRPTFILEPAWSAPRWTAHLRGPDATLPTLILHLPEGSGEPLAADGLVAAILPRIMRSGGSLHVAGMLTRTALRNLIEFAESWANWNPSVFHRISLTADNVVDIHPSSGRDAITAWSGGLRSTHTLVRHLDRLIPGAFTLSAAVRVTGLTPFEPDLEEAREALRPAGLPLRVVRVEHAEAFLDPTVGTLPIIAAALHASAGSAGWQKGSVPAYVQKHVAWLA